MHVSETKPSWKLLSKLGKISQRRISNQQEMGGKKKKKHGLMFPKGYFSEEIGTKLFTRLFLLGRIYSMKLRCSLKPFYSM